MAEVEVKNRTCLMMKVMLNDMKFWSDVMEGGFEKRVSNERLI